MNTNLSALKQFQNCQKYPKTLDKICPPAATIARTQQLFSAMGGEVQLTARKSRSSFSYRCQGLELESSGKGFSPEQAQASALMELAERYSWLHFAYENQPGYKECTFEDLPETERLPENYFLANLARPQDFAILLPTILATPQKWLPAQDLTTDKITAYPLTWHSMTMSSNGLAAGNCLPEAILQGLYEVIERENVCRLFMDQQPGRLLDLASCPYEDIQELWRQCRAQHIELTVLDISSTLQIPTFCVIGRLLDEPGTIIELGVGQGCHLNPHLALLRAITEYLESLAIQEENYLRHGSIMDQVQQLLPANHSGFLPTYNQEMLNKNAGMTDFNALPDPTSDNLLEDLQTVITMLAQQDFQVLYVDKTHPQLQIPVVRVVVPGMRSMISGAIYTPQLALAQIAVEAGQNELAYQSYLAYLQEDPLQKQLYSSPMMMMGLATGRQNPRRLLAGDYREHYLKSTRMKSQAGRLLSALTPLLSK